MEILEERYSITELSKRLGVTDHALRYYEKEFSLVIPKNDRGRRYYTPELSNIMYQIKRMRDEGLEIKAIKKILESENIINEPPPVVTDTDAISIVPLNRPSQSLSSGEIIEIRNFLNAAAENITAEISNEITKTSEHISKEIYKTKLELGACVENSVRKMESKMEKHFEKVDLSLTNWRSNQSHSKIKRIFKKILG